MYLGLSEALLEFDNVFQLLTNVTKSSILDVMEVRDTLLDTFMKYFSQVVLHVSATITACSFSACVKLSG